MSRGRFGIHGSQFIPETLMSAVTGLREAYEYYEKDSQPKVELEYLLEEYTGRLSCLYYTEKMTKDLGGARTYLKQEDLDHAGSYKIGNTPGRVLLAREVGKIRVIAETGAGRHDVAAAIAAAPSDLRCEVYMGEEDTDHRALNVYRIELLGVKVYPVTSGTQTLKDAVNEMLGEWTNRISNIHHVIGSVAGPHPFPMMVKDFQSIINKEVRKQFMEKEGKLPDIVIACVGGGSNAMGAFYEFIDEKDVKLVGCETAGRGVGTEQATTTVATGRLGIFHGMKSYSCQGEYGQVAPVYSISASLNYPGVGPEHTQLHGNGRVQYVPVTNDEAVNSFECLSRMEGIMPAIENVHTVAYARKIAGPMDKDQVIVVNLSGRGDRDVAAIAKCRGVEPYGQDTIGF